MNKTQINQLITSNRRSFRQGSVITSSELCEWFNIAVPKRLTIKSVQTYALAKVKAYTNLNKLLALNGLVIASKNFYEEFHVSTLEEANTRVNGLISVADGKTDASITLAGGIKARRGVWRKLTLKQLETIRTSSSIDRM